MKSWFLVPVACYVGALLIGPVTLLAQEGPSSGATLKTGSTIRVTLDDGRIVGRVRHLRGDRLGLAAKRPPRLREIPVSSIDRLEVSTGRRSHLLKGAAIGGGVGLATGALCASEEGGYVSAGDCYLAFGILGTALGAAVGGLLIRTHVWKPVPFKKGLRLSATFPPTGGFGAGLQLRMHWPPFR